MVFLFCLSIHQKLLLLIFKNYQAVSVFMGWLTGAFDFVCSKPSLNMAVIQPSNYCQHPLQKKIRGLDFWQHL